MTQLVNRTSVKGNLQLVIISFSSFSLINNIIVITPKYYSPYQIFDKIGLVAYQLDPLAMSMVHNALDVS